MHCCCALMPRISPAPEGLGVPSYSLTARLPGRWQPTRTEMVHHTPLPRSTHIDPGTAHQPVLPSVGTAYRRCEPQTATRPGGQPSAHHNLHTAPNLCGHHHTATAATAAVECTLSDEGGMQERGVGRNWSSCIRATSLHTSLRPASPALHRITSGLNLRAAGATTRRHTASMLSCPESPGSGRLIV